MADKKLTRGQIAKIVNGMSARDIFASAPTEEGAEVKGSEYAGRVFDAAAARQGYGEAALDRVGVGDAMYLSEALAGALNAGSPKADSSGESLTSADTGDSALS